MALHVADQRMRIIGTDSSTLSKETMIDKPSGVYQTCLSKNEATMWSFPKKLLKDQVLSAP